MKFLLIFILSFLSNLFLNAQNLDGAWQLIEYNGEEVTNREVIKVVQDHYFALGSRDLQTNAFLGAAGGEFEIKDNQLIENRDFDTYNASKIGEKRSYSIKWIGDKKIELSSPDEHKIWQKISIKTQDLDGNWVITGRQRNGEMKTMTLGDRRTIKILAGGRFQWVAFNSATKQFYASGGGTYSAENGVYQENIDFFSKDSDRVGASLKFEYRLKDGQWHHSGQSSTGKPIYEIWSRYQEVYKK